jgi:hypothetical protein
MGLLDGAPPLISLSVPPRTTCDWHIWASRQPTEGDDCFGYERPGDDLIPRGYLHLTSCRSTCGGRLSRAYATYEVLGPHGAPRRTICLASSTPSWRLGISTV